MLYSLVEEAIKQAIRDHKESQIGPLSGSNALVWDSSSICCWAEDTSNCPRIALLRRVADVQEDKKIESWLSNMFGRQFEEFLRNLRLPPEYVVVEEHEAQVRLVDEKGHEVVLVARPDKLIKNTITGQIWPVEIKTIQSNTTAHKVVISGVPKLGAVIQIVIYMYGHNLIEGELLYCIPNWFSGYDFNTKQKWKVYPGFKSFRVCLVDGHVEIDGKRTPLTVNKILMGAYSFLLSKGENRLPARPNWADVFAQPAQYNNCHFCPFSSVCDRFDNLQNTNLSEFFDACRKIGGS